MEQQASAFEVLIPAGGSARRLGGVDKPMVEVGGRTLLDRVIEACLGFGPITVVGPRRPTRRPVRWLQENPPGGGPVAAIAAGLHVCSHDWVGVFAADLPFLDADTVHSLWTTLAEADGRYDGALVADADGRDQWLAAIYRRDSLLGKLAEQGADQISGLSLRRLVENLRLLRVAAPGRAALDCDTWEDVAAARRIADQRPAGTS
jgi:molybdopterin-guanine dinucleotide biosynthesis protein A